MRTLFFKAVLFVGLSAIGSTLYALPYLSTLEVRNFARVGR